ncbi:MAG: hypothetical protein BGP00_16205 [Novosphingobium sp. 63-713]|uniref:ABC transporter substrate-binding protein n=1 Tax=unclassified Novosphingobium TaxID=2644732 RepID=UPI0009692FB6|nr:MULTISPECIES: ABC transporter substrate-binding protein [unclassified Novosphingobium]MBN9145927.1 ABC transporter substrate-binding protein [Novosphingobium sp.]MDR6709978.1 peptide/nickel transport system substrate-binding protein/oligopeptide transport system substrate-binding protein [Novosphingobium sp. 1748]OJX95852.1 MAG: hypothetical protein BGP00_16205 [Novosphingobium sp. 63-713]
MLRRNRISILMAALLAAACHGSAQQQPLRVVMVNDSGPAALDRELRAATAEGLVSLDEEGKVVPGLAERWIVADEGRGYIFRLRDSAWPDGTKLSGETARQALRRAIAAQKGRALGQDLTIIEDIRAMAGRVIEIRLAQPMPNFLQLLAQPELGLEHRGQGAGPMRRKHVEGLDWLTPISPDARGLPMPEGWAATMRPLSIRAMGGEKAVADLLGGQVDVVLGGRITDLPLIQRGLLGQRAARFDVTPGLFGLLVEKGSGFLAVPTNRAALAMVIDRAALVNALGMQAGGIPGWSPTTRLISPGIGEVQLPERWTDMDMDHRRAVAVERVAVWSKARAPTARPEEGDGLELRIAMPGGAGSNVLFSRLAQDVAAIGLRLRRVGMGESADLRVIDEVARYPSPVWFFNQLHCGVHSVCTPDVDHLVAQAWNVEASLAPALYAEAEREVMEANLFIPLALPVRWTMIGRGAGNGLRGLVPNAYGVHPFYPLADGAR